MTANNLAEQELHDVEGILMSLFCKHDTVPLQKYGKSGNMTSLALL
jgi:hypothetical protein